MTIRNAVPHLGYALAGAGVNVVLATVVNLLDIPLYFDSIGTVVVGIHLGLLPGLVTVVVTHILLWVSGQVLVPFVLCSALSLVIAVAFVRRDALGELGGYLWMGVLIGIANGVVGSILAYFVFEGVTDVHAIDRLVMGVYAAGRSLRSAVFWAGLLTNIIDKMLAALAAYYLRGPVSRLVQQATLSGEPEE